MKSPQPVTATATHPNSIPEICILLSFSLNKSLPPMVERITIPPLLTGKNMALGIMFESVRFILMYMQLAKPQRIINKIVLLFGFTL